MFDRKELKFMKKNYNNMLTLSLLGGGGQNNTVVFLNKYNNNYGKESLSN